MKTFTEQLRQAIEGCGMTRYRISKETGIDQSVLSRFMHGKTGMGIPAIDAVCELLKLKLVADDSKATTRKAR